MHEHYNAWSERRKLIRPPDTFSCRTFLSEIGEMRSAHLRREEGNWIDFRVERTIQTSKEGGYVVPMLPVEFHCHGLGDYDFSNFEELDLNRINELAREEGLLCLLCMFLPHQKLEAFLDFMQRYAREKQQANLTHLVGIALEGPMLGSFGGTPQQSMWMPTKTEWKLLAECGRIGLQYMVLSPDALLSISKLARGITDDPPNMAWIVSLLLEAGVRVALGHFQKDNPAASAQCVRSILQVVSEQHYSHPSRMILTDHLFNDMPLNFRHAWRTRQDRELRDDDLEKICLDRWDIDNLEQTLGEVPAVLLQAALEGMLTLCMNFDGEHVDLAICHRVIDLIGTESIIAMTDRVDGTSLGSQQLERREGSGLYYQKDGIVAAGSCSIERQMFNLRSIGFSEEAIWRLVSFTPSWVLGILPQYNDVIPRQCCYISELGVRYYIDDENLQH